MDERLYWIGFNLVKGIGAVRFRSILDHFGDAKSAWDASPAELAEAGLGGKVIERFVELRSTLDLENYRDQIHKQGIQVLIWPDAAYPTQLMEIEQPPPVLYIRGEITHEDRWAVAIVGTLITGEFAVEQGREVFAVPGNILAPQSKGCNKLIANGARPMLNAEDVLEALDLTRNIERREVRKAVPSDATEAALLEMLDLEPLHVDDIRAQSGLPIERITAALTMMELKGMVRQVGGMNYVAVREEKAGYETNKE